MVRRLFSEKLPVGVVRALEIGGEDAVRFGVHGGHVDALLVCEPLSDDPRRNFDMELEGIDPVGKPEGLVGINFRRCEPDGPAGKVEGVSVPLEHPGRGLPANGQLGQERVLQPLIGDGDLVPSDLLFATGKDPGSQYVGEHLGSRRKGRRRTSGSSWWGAAATARWPACSW